MPIDEEVEIIPGSPYGESKFILERMLHWLGQTHRLQSVYLLYFNAAGATETLGEDHHPETHLIPLVLQVAQGRRKEVAVFGDDYPTPDGTCVHDYIHLSDLALAHRLALESADQGSRVYNLGNGKGFSVREVIETARAVTGRPIPTVTVTRRPGDVPVLVACRYRIQRELGWKPRFTELRDILASAWAWQQEFPHGYPSN